MKRAVLGGALAALVLIAGVSPAQASRPISLGVSAGAALPNGDLGDFTSMGYNVTGSLGFALPAFPLSLRADGMFNQLSGKELPGEDVADLRFLALTGNVVYTLPGLVVRPYVIGGAGYYDHKAVGAEESNRDLGVNGGVGVRFALAGFSTFAEARLHNVFVTADSDESRDLRFIPITFGIMF